MMPESLLPPEQSEQEVYKYSAELMKSGASHEQIVTKLVERGLDSHAASMVVNKLAAPRARALVQVGRKNISYGALWCAGGIIVTAATSLPLLGNLTYSRGVPLSSERFSSFVAYLKLALRGTTWRPAAWWLCLPSSQCLAFLCW